MLTEMAEAHTKCSRRKHGLTSDAINVEDGWYGGHLNVELVQGVEFDMKCTYQHDDTNHTSSK